MAWWLASMAQPMGLARARGRLYDLGSYPGLVLSNDSRDWVIGEVYKLNNPQHALEHLDGYEGDEYERVQVEAYMHNGAPITCWAYRYKGSPDPDSRIISGDYLSTV